MIKKKHITTAAAQEIYNIEEALSICDAQYLFKIFRRGAFRVGSDWVNKPIINKNMTR